MFFEVVGDDLTIVLDQLEELAARIEASNLSSRNAKFEALGHEFLRLERAGIQLLTPEEFRTERDVQPTAFTRKIRRSIKRDVKRAVYRALERPVYE